MSAKANGRTDFRVCVEFMAPRELATPAVQRLLVAHRVAPMLAVHPGDDAEALEALAPYAAAGLPACAWPLLSDEEGYWPSERNVVRFSQRVAELLETARGRPPPWIAIDLEPPLGDLAALRQPLSWRAFPGLVDRAWHHLDRAEFEAAQRVYTALQHKIAATHTRTLAISYPFVAADYGLIRSQAMQDLCEAPLECGWDRIAIMTYGSLMAGYSQGLFSSEDVRWYGYRALGRMAQAFPGCAGAFLGIVGHGKLGDEPSYETPEELARDAAAARAAGVAEIGLFCLEGLLGRPNPEAWLQALTEPTSVPPPRRWRGELLHRGLGAIGLAAQAVRSARACRMAVSQRK